MKEKVGGSAFPAVRYSSDRELRSSTTTSCRDPICDDLDLVMWEMDGFFFYCGHLTRCVFIEVGQWPCTKLSITSTDRTQTWSATSRPLDAKIPLHKVEYRVLPRRIGLELMDTRLLFKYNCGEWSEIVHLHILTMTHWSLLDNHYRASRLFIPLFWYYAPALTKYL